MKQNKTSIDLLLRKYISVLDATSGCENPCVSTYVLGMSGTSEPLVAELSIIVHYKLLLVEYTDVSLVSLHHCHGGNTEDSL